jgi:hypothetical protein
MSIKDSNTSTRLADELAAQAVNRVWMRPRVLALDLEGTLLSNAVSQFPRPGLFEFLERANGLFPRLVMFTTVQEKLFRQIASTLAAEKTVPAWFPQLEYVHWTGATKDLAFIPDCAVAEALLVDDYAVYVHPGQQAQWVHVQPFQPPFEGGTDLELQEVLKELKERLRWGAKS